MSDYKTYDLGDFTLQSGEIIPSAKIAYKTFGDPSSPAIIYPTWYSGLISDNEWLIGSTKTLNPSTYFIIIPALFGNSQSSSPSNTSLSPFPKVTFYDNVLAQHTLVTEHLGITHAFAVLGWSMGAGQTYQWATQFPEFMDKIAPFCGSAKTSLHNQVFLEGVKTALVAAKGASSAADCSSQAPYNGSFTQAMQAIKAKALVLPCKTDLYFPPEDSEIEVQNMRDGIGRLEVFDSVWGHWAGGPGDSEGDVRWLDDKLKEFFAE
ncbi:homoserine O-acetyltransferase [Aureobasidium sp. EXF-12298]|nr:homoserine O-acetyltransferase [Aureobasidium sp. EXF-12298]